MGPEEWRRIVRGKQWKLLRDDAAGNVWTPFDVGTYICICICIYYVYIFFYLYIRVCVLEEKRDRGRNARVLIAERGFVYALANPYR